ncbi:MAG: PRC-barrel domain-containing protein, partial [Rubrivivax sp.]
VRASKLVGMNVQGAEGKNVGEISDLIVNLATGDVRYAIFEYDPSILKGEKVFAVPLQDMGLSADGKTLTYKQMSREQLDRAAVDKKDWKKAVANSQYIQNIDTTYGYTTDMTHARLMRASDVLGMDVNSREGKDIGDIKELVVDMAAGKVRYAVLAFDPSWLKGEKLYAFPLTSFSSRANDDELILNVGRDKLAAMKSFDPKGFEQMVDARTVQVNKAP